MKYLIYVINDNDVAAKVNLTRVCERRTKLLRGEKHTDYSIKTCQVALVILRRLARMKKRNTNIYEFAIADELVDGDMLIRCCRALEFVTVIYTSVAAELLRYRIVTRGSSICDRFAPKTRADCIGSSKVWYDKIRSHVLAANASLLVLAGATGVGKSSFVTAIAEELADSTRLLVVPNEKVDADNETALFECIIDAARIQSPHNPKERLIIVIDNVDDLHQGKLLLSTVREIATYQSRKIALIAICNNWFGRHAVNSLRNAVKQKLSWIKLVRCEPAPSAADIEKHLAVVLPQSTPEIRAAIAVECSGDVRAAMLRAELETLTRAQSKSTSSFINHTVNDRFSPSSIAEQTREVVGEMKSQRAMMEDLEFVWTLEHRGRVGDFHTPVERRLQTLELAQNAEDMLFANYPRMLPPSESESTNILSDLMIAARMCESQSQADMMRTNERKLCYRGASENMTLAVGFTAPANFLSRRPLPTGRTPFLEMDFKHATVRAQSQRTAALLGHIAATARAGAALLTNGATVFANDSRQELKPRGEFMSSVTIDTIEHVISLGRFSCPCATLSYATRMLETATFNPMWVAPGSKYVREGYDFAFVKANAARGYLVGLVEEQAKEVREHALAEAKLRIDSDTTITDDKVREQKTRSLAVSLEEEHYLVPLRRVAHAAAQIGLDENEFVSAVQFGESVRNMGEGRQPAVTDEKLLSRVFRETRNKHQRTLLHRLDIDMPTAKRARIDKKKVKK
jgi:hypothetical protein